MNRNIHRKIPVLESLFNEVAGMTLLKRGSNRGVFLRIFKIIRTSFFYRTLPVAASKWENVKSKK